MPAGDVHGTRPFSDTHLHIVFLVLSLYFSVSALSVVATRELACHVMSVQCMLTAVK